MPLYTKAECVRMWKDHYLPLVKRQYEQDGKPDYIARSESWNDYIDFMVKDRQVGSRAYDWTHPRICGP